MSTSKLQIGIDTKGKMTFIYNDELAGLFEQGRSVVKRASHVEPIHVIGGSLSGPTPNVGWIADMSPVGGPVLGPFVLRSEALSEEVDWLNQHLFGGDNDTGQE